MRVYSYPQPPHILTKYIPPRLAIVEFFWQTILMSTEHIPTKLYKPTFLWRCFKVEDFLVGKNDMEELNDYLGEYNFSTGPYRMYDPYNYIRTELKAIRGHVWRPSKNIPIKDLMANIVATRGSDELLRNY